MKVDHQLVFVVSTVLYWVAYPIIGLKSQHGEFLGKVVGHDLL